MFAVKHNVWWDVELRLECSGKQLSLWGEVTAAITLVFEASKVHVLFENALQAMLLKPRLRLLSFRSCTLRSAFTTGALTSSGSPQPAPA